VQSPALAVCRPFPWSEDSTLPDIGLSTTARKSSDPLCLACLRVPPYAETSLKNHQPPSAPATASRNTSGTRQVRLATRIFLSRSSINDFLRRSPCSTADLHRKPCAPSCDSDYSAYCQPSRTHHNLSSRREKGQGAKERRSKRAGSIIGLLLDQRPSEDKRGATGSCSGLAPHQAGRQVDSPISGHQEGF
jgi:hypothetical protein